MKDIEIFKRALLNIKCNFSSVKTLFGNTVSVYSETKETQFEFDGKGKFKRVI